MLTQYIGLIGATLLTFYFITQLPIMIHNTRFLIGNILLIIGFGSLAYSYSQITEPLSILLLGHGTLFSYSFHQDLFLV